MDKKYQSAGLFLPFIIPVIIIVLWEVGVAFGFLPETLIARPTVVLSDAIRLVLNGELIWHSFVSSTRLLAGFVIGAVLGVMVGVYVGFFKTAEKIISPTVRLIAPIPAIAWIPLLIILFGIGEFSKIALLALGVFFITFVSTVKGIRNADIKLIEMARVYEKSDSELLLNILIPGALADIFAGLRISLGLAWVLLIAAELIASSSGLGWLILDSRNFSRPDDMIVAMVAIGVLGKISDELLKKIEEKVTAWRRTFGGK